MPFSRKSETVARSRKPLLEVWGSICSCYLYLYYWYSPQKIENWDLLLIACQEFTRNIIWLISVFPQEPHPSVSGPAVLSSAQLWCNEHQTSYHSLLPFLWEGYIWNHQAWNILKKRIPVWLLPSDILISLLVTKHKIFVCRLQNSCFIILWMFSQSNHSARLTTLATPAY